MIKASSRQQKRNILCKVRGNQVFVETVARSDYLWGSRLVEQIARSIDEDIRELIARIHIPANGDEGHGYVCRQTNSVLDV